MKKILLDTNFLMIPGQFLVDIFDGIAQAMHEPYELIVLDKSLSELEKLATGNSMDARAARLALALVRAHEESSPTILQKIVGLAPQGKQKRLKVVSVSGKGYVDDALLRIADDDTLVATQDAALRRRLRERGIPCVVLVQKKHIKIINA